MNRDSNNTIDTQARDWSIRLSGDDVDKHMLDEFDQWRSADSRHEAAFQKVDKVWLSLSSLNHLKGYAVLPEPEPSSVQRFLQSLVAFYQQPKKMAFAGAFCVMLVVTAILLPTSNTSIEPNTPRFSSIAYVSGKAEIREVILPDQTVLTLAPETHLRVNYSADQRRVLLRKGKALFKVTKNTQRPFIVVTGDTETRVLGTVFEVDRRGDAVKVAVQEGRVRVSPKNEGTKKTTITGKILIKGQGVNANTHGDIAEIYPVEVKNIDAWVQGRLLYKNATLANVIADANRYTKAHITLANKELGLLPLSISFTTDHIDQMLDNLTKILPIQVDRTTPGVILLRKK